MPTASVYNMSGKKELDINLNAKMFSCNVKSNILHDSVLAQLANARNASAHTKTRGEVSGGGIKPWKQKGTGRARAGSSRSPLWTGGGVTFGPRNARNFSQKINKKVRKLAIYMALSTRLVDKNIIVVHDLSFNKIKTSNAEKFLQSLPIKEGTILLIIPKKDRNLELSFRNLPYVKILLADSLNVVDVLKFDWLIFSQPSLEIMQKTYLAEDSIIPDIAKVKQKSAAKTRKTKPKVAKVSSSK